MDFLSGLHPKFVHFPIAFLMVYPVMELLFILTKKEFFNKSANLFLIIGVAGALLAVLTGNTDFQLNNKLLKENSLVSEHQQFANYSVWLFTCLFFLRIYFVVKKKINIKIAMLLFVISLAGVYFIFKTGTLGGKVAEEKIKNKLAIEYDHQLKQ